MTSVDLSVKFDPYPCTTYMKASQGVLVTNFGDCTL